MDAEDEPHADWVATERRWTQGWRRFVLPTVFLVYLGYVAQSVEQNNDGGAAFAGYAILVAFAVAYLLLIAGGPEGGSTRFWTLYGICLALFVAEVPFARAAAFVMCLYLAAMSVARLDTRAAPIVVAMAVAALVVPSVIPSWHQDLGDAWGTVTPVAIPVVAIVSLGVRQVFRSNRELGEARVELARLAAENERFRIARDLHDLLGHSLTTITVKAGLARQLGEADPARSQQEIAEVEDLARRSLADVRAAVANYRDVTLAGELATGRELLRAAGITADLPRASTPSTRPTRSCSGGSCARASPTSCATPTPARARSGCRSRRSRSWTTASGRTAGQAMLHGRTPDRGTASPASESALPRPAVSSTPARSSRTAGGYGSR